tara:strand:- start:3588 stop:3929 length:342 start_codon:yes stop_codon:yes gene_type:complete
MDRPLIFIGIILIIGVGSLAIFLLRSTSQIKIKAIDGTLFPNQSECTKYELLLSKLSCLYEDDIQPKQNILGMRPSFVSALRTNGFSDLKTLLLFKDDLNTLVNLINEEIPKS